MNLYRVHLRDLYAEDGEVGYVLAESKAKAGYLMWRHLQEDWTPVEWYVLGRRVLLAENIKGYHKGVITSAWAASLMETPVR